MNYENYQETRIFSEMWYQMHLHVAHSVKRKKMSGCIFLHLNKMHEALLFLLLVAKQKINLTWPYHAKVLFTDSTTPKNIKV